MTVREQRKKWSLVDGTLRGSRLISDLLFTGQEILPKAASEVTICFISLRKNTPGLSSISPPLSSLFLPLRPFFAASLPTLSAPIGSNRRPPAYSVTDIIRFGGTALGWGDKWRSGRKKTEEEVKMVTGGVREGRGGRRGV